MIEALYASLFLVAGGIAITATFYKKGQRISGEVLGTSIVMIGIVAAVDAFYPFSAVLVYTIVVIGFIITVASVYLMFAKSPKAAA